MKKQIERENFNRQLKCLFNRGSTTNLNDSFETESQQKQINVNEKNLILMTETNNWLGVYPWTKLMMFENKKKLYGARYSENEYWLHAKFAKIETNGPSDKPKTSSI